MADDAQRSLQALPQETGGDNREEWTDGDARLLLDAEICRLRLCTEYAESVCRPRTKQHWVPDDIKAERKAIRQAISQVRKLWIDRPRERRDRVEQRQRQQQIQRKRESVAARVATISSVTNEKYDWSEADAQELEKVDVEASKLSREFARFLVTANIRDDGGCR